MKVLWIASWFPTPYSLFNGDFIERMGNAVSSYCDICLLHVGEGPVDKTIIVTEKKDFIRILVTVPFSKKWNLPLRFFRLFKGLRKGLRIVKKEYGTFNLLHLHVIYPLGIFCLLFPSLRKLPLVITEHWAGYSALLNKALRFDHLYNAKICARHAKIVLPVSDSLMNDMRANGINGDFRVIPNVVDLETFKPGLANKDNENGSFTFLVVASLIDEIKNISGIVRAYEKSLTVEPDTNLILIGGGEDEQKLNSLVISLGISERVSFVGEVLHEEVAKFMQNVSVLVLFSRIETFSCVIAEAMSVGLPVISSNCGGITSNLKQPVGLSVDIDDEIALSNAMVKLKRNYHQFNPFVRREEVSRYSMENVGIAIYELYGKLI